MNDQSTASAEIHQSLADRYAGIVCDLDGVVYRGPDAVPHAASALNAASRSGRGIVFATNNASRTPQDVADQLAALGVELRTEQVLTSSMAAARWLAGEFGDGARVLVVGGDGARQAIIDEGLSPVTPAQSRADASEDAGPVRAVLQGYGTDVTAGDLAEGAYAIQAGARWVATNDDQTLPAARGVAPGNGAFVAALGTAVDVDPVVIGKPGPLLYQFAADALGTPADATLAIGDRLETDIAGATAAGMDGLHVLTGVHGPKDLVAAPANLRPRFVADDLRALGQPYDEPTVAADGAVTAAGLTGSLRLGGEPIIEFAERDAAAGDETVVRLRIALRLLWDALDRGDIDIEQALSALPADQ